MTFTLELGIPPLTSNEVRELRVLLVSIGSE